MNKVNIPSNTKIGLALGSGSSRGWSHIGVLKALAEMGIEPDVISGTSVGALIGAAYVANRIDELEEWACSLSKIEEARFFDINASLNGFVNIKRFKGFLKEYVGDEDFCIEDCEKKFAAVATDLDVGREVWLTKGSLMHAVWASMSLPGLFPAIRHEDCWLVDGGLVNPVPVSACRALGADIVIAVNLNGDIVGKHRNKRDKEKSPQVEEKKSNGVAGKLTDLVKDYSVALFSNSKDDTQSPGLLGAIAGSISITQDRITRSRLAGDPPDILLAPKLANIGLLEIYRAPEAIEEGKKNVAHMAEEITSVVEA